MKKLIGKIDVDSGLVQVGDPCYESWANGLFDKFKRWCKFLDLPENLGTPTILKHGRGNPGRGIVVSTPHGDGSYPVYGEFNQRGQLIRLTVDLEG